VAIDLRPRSATEIVDASFQLLRHHLLELTTLSVAAHLPLLLVRLAVSARTPADPMAAGTSQSLYTFPLSILAALLQFGAPLPVTIAASQLYLGDTYDARAAVRRALERYWSTLAAVIMRAILIFLAALLFVVPAIYVALRYAPVEAVSLLEGDNSTVTISRSWALSRDSAWHIFLAWLPLIAIYAGLFALVWWVLLSGEQLALLRHASEVAVFETALSACIYPITSVVMVVLYYDLRTRKEGFDVEMMSRAAAR
jgi:hypothetical protein